MEALSGRLAALDGLRGLAALLVVFFHIGWPNHFTNNQFVQNGYLAVDLFFIMSGFVIFGNYAERINSLRDYGNFIGLRFFRVYPLHFATLALLFGAEVMKLLLQRELATPSAQLPFTGNNSSQALVANVALVQGWHILSGSSWNIPSWSISCEFAAYLVFGIVALAGLMRRALFIAVVPIATLTYFVLAFAYDGLDVTYDWGVARCLAGFFLGAAMVNARWIVRLQRESWFDATSIIVVIAVSAVMSLASGTSVVLVVPLFVLLVALLASDGGTIARILVHPAIQYLGRVSYSIYMIQFITILGLTIVVKRLFKVPAVQDAYTQRIVLAIDPWVGDLLVMLSVGAILIIAGFAYRWVEAPGREFGRRHIAGPKARMRARPAE
jgi:peptidoglycan/LPS O-acetylase OafA/YrhL